MWRGRDGASITSLGVRIGGAELGSNFKMAQGSELLNSALFLALSIFVFLFFPQLPWRTPTWLRKEREREGSWGGGVSCHLLHRIKTEGEAGQREATGQQAELGEVSSYCTWMLHHLLLPQHKHFFAPSGKHPERQEGGVKVSHFKKILVFHFNTSIMVSPRTCKIQGVFSQHFEN